MCEVPFVVSPSNHGSAERDIENETVTVKEVVWDSDRKDFVNK